MKFWGGCAALVCSLCLGIPAGADDVEKQLEIAKEYGNARLYDKAIETAVPIAIDGDPRAQMLLGSIYLAKKNEEDFMRGHTWIARAAQAGEHEALLMLWSSLSLKPELDNFNPWGDDLGNPRRALYAVSLLQMAAEISQEDQLLDLNAEKEQQAVERNELTWDQVEEALAITNACIENEFEECAPIEVFVRE